MRIESNPLNVQATGFYTTEESRHEQIRARRDGFRKKLHQSLAALGTGEDPEAALLVDQWNEHDEDAENDPAAPPGYDWHQ